MKISYPDSFKPQDNPNFKEEGPLSGSFLLGDIPGHGQGKLVFNGRVYSPKGALIYLKADLDYYPSGYSSQYKSRGQLGINVNTTPISLEVMSPQSLASGDEVNYLITYNNNGENEFTDLRIRAHYSEGFIFSSCDPKSLEGDNIWYVGKLSPGMSGKITVSGRLEGDRDNSKKMKVSIGTLEKGSFVSYDEEEASIKIADSPIAISQTVNNAMKLSANAGEMLRFNINYLNEGDIDLKNVIVKAKIDSPVLDYSILETERGFFDSNTKTITWKSSDHSELGHLGPGKGGSLSFSIKIKEVIPVDSTNDKNFVISSIVKIDSPDIPTRLQKTVISVSIGNQLPLLSNSIAPLPE